MADCAENLATATSDNEEKSLKDEHTSPNVEKDACLPPPPETCTNIQNRTVEPAGSAELYPHVSVITPLNEDDRNCEEITSDNKDYCNESYENCDDIDSRDPAEMCESTLEEISGNEPWIIVDSVEDDSESFENSSECRDQSVHNESFQASKSDKEENENLSCPRESSPCLITISEVRQNEPWLSDDSGSNIGKNGLPKEEFILSETTCKTIQEEEEPEEPVCSSEATAEFKTDSAEGCLVNPVNCVNENENKNIVQSSPVTETEINNENVLSEDGNENNQTETLTDEKCNQDDLKQSHEEPMDISEIKETCKESVEMSDAKQILEELEISNVKQSGDESVEAESIERNCEESVEESDAKQNCKESVDISSEKQSCEELMEVSSVEQNFNEEPMEVENTRPENDSDSVETKENKSENAECGQKVDKEVVSECEEEKINSIESSNEDCTLEKSKDSSSDKKISETAENKNHSKEKVSQEINFEEKDSSAINEEEKKKESEAEIKGYITDTMNELLGLFGYDNVDESMKDNLKLEKISSSISGKKTPELSDQASSKSVEPVKKDSSSRVCTECHALSQSKLSYIYWNIKEKSAS
ncbi:myb-like protein X [Centruroides sculpturatus]|uniref:myb-like protein X n=1 Tax=Centruroides sculpturatus TaxID=218467 RepID=UPI000C6D4F9A|nr:myb-like protein X [Centruroides sculpturatus]